MVCVALAATLGVLRHLAAATEGELRTQERELGLMQANLQAHHKALRAVPRIEAAPPGGSGLVSAGLEKVTAKHGLGHKFKRINRVVRPVSDDLQEVRIDVNFQKIDTRRLFMALLDVQDLSPYIKVKELHTSASRRARGWWTAYVTLAAYERREAGKKEATERAPGPM